MSRFTLLFWVASGVNFLSPLLPVLAFIHQQRSGKYQVRPWMAKLGALLMFQLLVNWGMLGTSINGRHNDWLEDMAYLPEMVLSLRVLDGIGERVLPKAVLLACLGLMGGSAAINASQVGLEKTWPLAWTVASLLLLALCLWQLLGLITRRGSGSIWSQPAFWLLTSWPLMLGVDLTFYPLHNFFLKSLSRSWILVPWFAKYVIGLILNLGVARTFLCPKPSSS